MAYDGTIPSLSNQIGNDIPQMQENFSLLESAQVVDEGSAEDGDYIRYENGWQVCIIQTSVPKEETENEEENTQPDWSTYDWDWVLPQSFADNNYVISGALNLRGAARGENGLVSLAGASPLETDKVEVRLMTNTKNFDEFDPLTIKAIGMWK